MRLLLERFGFGHDSTLGGLYLLEDGQEPDQLAFTIEDERRKVKVPGETCIPEGVYMLKFRTEGGLHAKYAKRFGVVHRGMLWLQNVRGFTYVYLHIGNTDDDTDGCPLLVDVPIVDPNGEFRGGGSEKAYRKVYQLIAAALDTGEDVVLSVSERKVVP